MHANASLIDQMRQILPELNKAERRVAETILVDIDAAAAMNTRDLSEKAQVSEPTIVRFARRMGASGFRDFKMRLTRDFATGRMFVMSEPTGLAADPVAIVSQVYEATAQALAYSFAQRDPVALDAAATAIHAARRVFCMGVGGSSANVAAEAENRLYRFDIAVSTIIDPYRQPVAASLSGPNDVLLFFSVTGRPASLLEAARLARGNGAVVIAITRRNSPLAETASVTVPLDIPDDDQRFEIPNRSRYGQLYMLDCIATLVAMKRAGIVSDKLHGVREVLRAIHDNADSQPIGD